MIEPQPPDNGECPVKCDLSCDLVNVALQEASANHRNMMLESRGNAQQTHQLVRASSGVMYTKQDPVEAAAVEIITGGQQRGTTT